MLGSSGVSLTQVTNLLNNATAGLQTATQVDTAIAAAIAAIPTPVLNFVAGGSYITLQQLYTNYPASATYDGMYANISNLYNGVSLSAAGGLKEVVRCRYDIANNTYSWTEQRPNWNVASASTGGTITLIPLVTPPTIRLTGTLLGNLTVTPSTTNAYVGQKFKVIQNSTLGLFATSLTGLIGSNITLLGNTVQEIEYMSNGWAKAST